MKTKLRGLTLTAMLLSASQLTLAEEGSTSVVGDLSPSVGDPASVVGDLPGYGEEAYFHEEATYAPGAEVAAAGAQVAAAGAEVAAAGAVAHQYISSDPETYPPVGVSELRQVDHHVGLAVGSPCGGDYCDGGCDGGCDSACGKKRRFGQIGRMLGLDNDTWATTEALMWFVQDRDMPSLVTISSPGTAPILPAQGAPNPDAVTSVFGDDIDGEISGGIRADIGKFVTSRIGIGGRFWAINDNTDSYYRAGDGTDVSIGRPFFNTNTDAEDAVLVAVTPGATGFSGEVAAQSTLELWAAEAYARVRFGCEKDCRLDLIGGYSHFDINDKLAISSTSIQTTPATGQTTTLSDFFNSRNKFDGGQVGFEMMMTRGRWMVRSLTKVHLGNMQQNVRIAGGSRIVTPPGAPTDVSGGLLAMGNQGEYERNEFAFIPEANFKLAYCIRKNMYLSAGYSFIYFDNVALNGDAVDRSVDGTTIGTGVFGTRPAFEFDDSSLWVQGLDLGLVLDY